MANKAAFERATGLREEAGRLLDQSESGAIVRAIAQIRARARRIMRKIVSKKI
jgi:hypothetical protein